MIKKLARSIREYKKPSIWTVVFIVLEVIIEVLIPFMAKTLIDKVSTAAELGAEAASGLIWEIIGLGGLLILMAAASLTCGGIAARTCAKASTGFAKNLRHDLFEKIQTFSFENIDKFSSTSLVTRLTTDVANVQMSYMMIIRTAIRAPLMLIFAIIMGIALGGKLALHAAANGEHNFCLARAVDQADRLGQARLLLGKVKFQRRKLRGHFRRLRLRLYHHRKRLYPYQLPRD